MKRYKFLLKSGGTVAFYAVSIDNAMAMLKGLRFTMDDVVRMEIEE